MPEILILLIKMFIAHFVGDFTLQSRDMAVNKSHSLKHLFKHVGVYWITTFLLVFMLSGFLEVWAIISWSLVNAGFHLITDFFTSKASAYFYETDQTYKFWNMIGFDQLIHIITIIITASIYF